MSLKQFKEVAKKFINNKSPAVLAIKGAWGVGKTYVWDKLTEEQKVENYCYVSLFGINSLSELRLAILVELVPSTKLLQYDWLPGCISHAWNWVSKFFPCIPKKMISSRGIKSLTFFGVDFLFRRRVEKVLICFDDFERLSSNIEVEEFLGFISQLKEEKNCRVVLIFNEDQLQGKAEVYKKYREKVIDQEFVFSPTVEEVIEIAFPSDLPHRDLAIKHVGILEIKNIRILQKIVRLVQLIGYELKNLHEDVIKQAIQDLILFLWCIYDSSKNKPTIDFLKKYNPLLMSMNLKEKKTEINPQEVEWYKLLSKYEFIRMDDFSCAILKIVECGYIDEEVFSVEKETFHADCVARSKDKRFIEIVNACYDNFSSDDEDFVSHLKEFFEQNLEYLPCHYLDILVKRLRYCSRDQDANNLIDRYVFKKSELGQLYNLNNSNAEINDQYLKDSWVKAFEATQKETSLLEAVTRISQGSYSPEHVDVASRATERDFYDLFKSMNQADTRQIVSQFLKYAGEDKTTNAVRALKQIAQESRIEAFKIKQAYQIDV